MTKQAGHAYRLVVAATAVTLLLSGCTTLQGAFGDRKSGLADVANIEFYASDQALAEAKNHFRQRNYGHSATFYKRAAELEPKDAEAWIGLAASYDRLRRFDLADRAYRRLFALIGGTVQYYNNVGYSNLLRGNLVVARQNFLKAYELEPDNIVVANNLELLGASSTVVQR
jgi:Flp pilus assembly protein TadD